MSERLWGHQAGVLHGDSEFQVALTTSRDGQELQLVGSREHLSAWLVTKGALAPAPGNSECSQKRRQTRPGLRAEQQGGRG